MRRATVKSGEGRFCTLDSCFSSVFCASAQRPPLGWLDPRINRAPAASKAVVTRANIATYINDRAAGDLLDGADRCDLGSARRSGRQRLAHRGARSNTY